MDCSEEHDNIRIETLFWKRALGEHKDCTVKAVSVVCQVPYPQAWEELRKQGRQYRRGLTKYPTKQAIKNLGYSLTDVTTKFAKCKTMRTLTPVLRRYPNNEKTYLIDMNGHVAAAYKGVLHDWTLGRCFRILTIWEVNKVE